MKSDGREHYENKLNTFIVAPFTCTFLLSKVRNPELKPGNKVLLFPGFVLSKDKKTITFSITLSMLGEPGLYFLYFLQYLGCDDRMK